MVLIDVRVIGLGGASGWQGTGGLHLPHVTKLALVLQIDARGTVLWMALDVTTRRSEAFDGGDLPKEDYPVLGALLEVHEVVLEVQFQGAGHVVVANAGRVVHRAYTEVVGLVQIVELHVVIVACYKRSHGLDGP